VSYGVYRHICAAVAEFPLGSGVGNGDSGSPVLQLLSGSADVYAIGLLFAEALVWKSFPPPAHWQHIGVFSSLDALQYWLYNQAGWLVDVTNVPLLRRTLRNQDSLHNFASIAGTELMEPGATCHWYSGTNIPEAVYEWSIDGSVVGTNADLYLSRTSTFALNLRVRNEILGVDIWAMSKHVTVQEEAGECFDQ